MLIDFDNLLNFDIEILPWSNIFTMKTMVLPGKSIRVLNNYVLFYSVYDENLISAFKGSRLKWDKNRKAWYADLHDFENTKDFLDRLSTVLSYFPQEEIIYAAHFVNSFYSRLSNIIELSRKESSDFPVPLPEGLSLYPYQRAGVEFLVNKQNVLLADAMGLGKEEWVNNRVWTPEGRKRIGDLKVGDKIFGISGKLVNVVGVYPQGKKKLYRVTFNDGCSVLVGLNHLWKVINNSGEEFVLSTRQLIDKNATINHFGKGRNKNKKYTIKTFYRDKYNSKWKIPMTQPLIYGKKYLPIDPYFLGVLIGNGKLKDGLVLSMNAADEDIVNSIALSLKDVEFKRIKSRSANVFEFRIVSKFGNYFNPLKRELKKFGLRCNSTDKFIPDIYKYSSIEDRLAILQGLLDTDGYVSKDGMVVEFYTTSQRLAEDVQEIVHSLGGICRHSVKKVKYKEHIKICHILRIKLPAEFTPFRSRRKLQRYSPPVKYPVSRRIEKIEFERVDEAVCIQVDSPDCLYLTEYAIVTHNTVQVIGYLNYESKQTGKTPQSLIICPSSVKYNWLKELNKWSINPLNIEVLEGRNGFEQNFDVDIYICNYDILQGKEFKNLDCIVLDEAHYIKNQYAIRTREVQRICKSNLKAKIIALTGTPMLNRPAELFPVLNLLLPQKFDNFFRFAHKYCAAHKKQIQTRDGIKEFWDFNGASNTEELGRLLRVTIMLRREKSQVLKELPEKIRTVIPVKKNAGKVFLDLEERTRGMMDKIREINKKIKEAKKNGDRDLLNKLKLEKTQVRSVAFTLMNEYRRYAFEEKKEIIVDFLSDTLESEPVIVFVHHRDVAKFFRDTFRQFNPLVITGETPADERAKLVEAFQTKDEYLLFIATTLAAAEGITLTKASTVVFAEYEWTPAKMLQAEGRVHRIGQKNTVNSYWFALVGSVDEYFINKIIEKLQVEHEIMQDTEEEEIFMAVE